jgi:NADH dehydrogenase FAD-containing subunit
MAHRIVVVGGGAGGLELATRLGRTLGKNRLEGKPIADYQYKDYGPLVSLAKYSAVGNLMGSLMGSVKVEGWLARMFYVSLYRMHQRFAGLPYSRQRQCHGRARYPPAGEITELLPAYAALHF